MVQNTVKKIILIFILTILITTTLAYSTAIYIEEVGQLGASEKTPVAKYNLRVYSVSISVENNQITSITITVASSTPRTYKIYATITSGSCSATASWSNVYLTTDPTPLSSSLSPPYCNYDPPGATVEVRGEPA
jgi:hypothetical protein